MIDPTDIAPMVAAVELDANDNFSGDPSDYQTAMTRMLGLPDDMADEIANQALFQVNRVEIIVQMHAAAGRDVSDPRARAIIAFSLGIGFAAAVQRLKSGVGRRAFTDALRADLVIPGLERAGALSAAEILALRDWFSGERP